MGAYIFINQYASTPEEGFGGRYYYFSKVLQEQGNQVLLVTSANHHLLRKKPKFFGLWHFSNYKGLDVLWLKTIPYSKANSPLRIINWLIFTLYMPFLKLLRRRPDQLHFSSPAPIAFLGVWILSKLLKTKTVFDVRDVWPETLVEIGGISRTNPVISFLYWVEKFAFRKADVVTSNLANLDVRLNELSIDSEKFFWIPNGVDINGVETSLCNSSFELPDQCLDKKVIGYTGTLGEANAVLTLIKVAELLKDKTDYVFLIVGDGKEKERLILYCNEHGLDNVFFMDSVSKADVYKVQSLMDVLCVGAKPSPLYRYGVSPNKLYEYICSGVPIVYYVDTAGYHPVADADCGLEVKPDDLSGFSESIIKLASLDAEERSKYRARAKKYIQNNHLYENLAVKLVHNVEQYIKNF